jgi:chromosomal replication initiation ATPase DnaA
MKVQSITNIDFDFEAEVRRQVKNLIPAMLRLAAMSQSRKRRPSGVQGQLEVLSMVYLDHHMIQVSEIKKQDRSAFIRDHRHVLCYILIKHYDFTTVELGKFLNRDHSTILSSISRVESLQKVHPEWRLRIKEAFKLY